MPTDAVKNDAGKLRVFIIEDYEEDAVLLERHLRRAGYDIVPVRIETAAQLEEALADPRPPDLVIADYTLPSFGARDALAMIQQRQVEVPFIIVSGTIDEVSAVNAMRAGAHDYVLKGHLERLLPAIERELADARLRKERMRTEAELRRTQQMFSATFNQAAVGMAHTTTEGRFLLVNQRLADMLGATVEQVLALSIQDFALPSERERGEATHAELLRRERSGYSAERNLVRRDGTTFPAQLTVSLLTPSGHEGSAVLWVVEDISARRAAERETADLMSRLINSERLAAAGRMANTLAHEINNPLEALTNIFFLLPTFNLEPTAREMVEVGARELERVGHITRSTLSFYRKVPGKTIDLHSMLDEVAQLFASRAQQHQVGLVLELNENTREAHFDPSLRQVFANVIGNALEAMEGSGGRIRVRARVCDGVAWVTVSDTGHGIDPSLQAQVFEPFFTTKGEKGTGLGLWVTRGIVEEHGGRLLLRSATRGPRRGTLIRIELPVGAESANADERTTVEAGEELAAAEERTTLQAGGAAA